MQLFALCGENASTHTSSLPFCTYDNNDCTKHPLNKSSSSQRHRSQICKLHNSTSELKKLWF